MTANLKKILVVAGPTAVGKSATAMSLATQYKSEIISLDSVQGYKYFNIGSAKVNSEERHLVRHHLIDIFEPDQEINAAKFTALADLSITQISDSGKIPVITGGSNLYLKSLLHGLSEVPAVSDDFRQELNQLSLTDLYGKLKVLDPKRAAELHPNDKSRIVRSLEIINATGETVSSVNTQHEFSNVRYQALILVLVAERQKLLERIKIRTSKMLSEGLIEETESIIKKYGRSLPALKSIGYAQALDYIDGKIKSNDLAESIIQATRRYAKQQMTFWKNEPAKRGWRLLNELSDDCISVNLNSAENETDYFVRTRSIEQILEAKLTEDPFMGPEIRYLFCCI